MAGAAAPAPGTAPRTAGGGSAHGDVIAGQPRLQGGGEGCRKGFGEGFRNGWMNGCGDGWMQGWMGGCRDGWMQGLLDAGMDAPPASPPHSPPHSSPDAVAAEAARVERGPAAIPVCSQPAAVRALWQCQGFGEGSGRLGSAGERDEQQPPSAPGAHPLPGTQTRHDPWQGQVRQ